MNFFTDFLNCILRLIIHHYIGHKLFSSMMTIINLALLHDLLFVSHLYVVGLCIIFLSDFINRLELINFLDLMEGLFL